MKKILKCLIPIRIRSTARIVKKFQSRREAEELQNRKTELEQEIRDMEVEEEEGGPTLIQVSPEIQIT